MKLIRFIQQRIADALATSVDARGLALFRILYALVLFMEVLGLYQFHHLIYDAVPYLEPAILPWGAILVVWMVLIACICLGLFYRLTSVMSWLLSVACIGWLSDYEYHMFYIYLGVNFLLMFAPAHRAISLDRLLLRARIAGGGVAGLPAPRCSVLNYRLLVLLGIGLVYFDSIFHKLSSEVWLAGLGVWLPASLPMVAWNDVTPVLNQKLLIVAAGYLTLAFEACFLFLFWWRRFALPLFVVGSALHLAISWVFPIPYFGVGYLALYLLVLPPEFWSRGTRFGGVLDRLAQRLSQSLARASCWKILQPRQPRWVPSLRLRQNAVMAFIFVVCGSQAVMILDSPVLRSGYAQLGLEGAKPIKKLRKRCRSLKKVSAKTLGITKHGVFVDAHFDGYNHIIRVRHVASGQYIPVTDERGTMGAYLQGPIWAKWGYRVNGPVVDRVVLADGLRDFTVFWLGQGGYDVRGKHAFTIEAKWIALPEQWTPDYLRNSLEGNWKHVGDVNWDRGEFSASLIDIEAMNEEDFR